MKTLEELKKEARQIDERLDELEEKDELSNDEREEFRNKTDKLSNLMDDIKTKEKREKQKETFEDRSGPGIVIDDEENRKGEKDTEFRNLGDFVSTAIKSPGDERLEEKRAMASDAGVDGGIFIPDQFSDQIMQFEPNDAVVRPRATVIPPGENPDAKLTTPTLKQGDKGVNAGVQVYWEEDEISESSTPEFGEVSLEPEKFDAFAEIKNDLLRNSTAASMILRRLFRNAIAQDQDNKYLEGNGSEKPLGIRKSDALVSVTRDTTDSIKYADINNMEKQMVGEALDNAIWVINRGALNEIKNMADGNGNTVYDPGNRPQGIPDSLDGYPIVWTRRTPSLGSAGDIMLINFSYYWIKDGSGLFIQASEHAEFKKDKTVIKVVGHTDGQSWVSEKLKAEDGTYVSPFVELAA